MIKKIFKKTKIPSLKPFHQLLPLLNSLLKPRLEMLRHKLPVKIRRCANIVMPQLVAHHLQTARKMKAKGLNIALIAEITGLSEKEIEGLDICG
jgi:hypothetical protein